MQKTITVSSQWLWCCWSLTSAVFFRKRCVAANSKSVWFTPARLDHVMLTAPDLVCCRPRRNLPLRRIANLSCCNSCSRTWDAAGWFRNGVQNATLSSHPRPQDKTPCSLTHSSHACQAQRRRVLPSTGCQRLDPKLLRWFIQLSCGASFLVEPKHCVLLGGLRVWSKCDKMWVASQDVWQGLKSLGTSGFPQFFSIVLLSWFLHLVVLGLNCLMILNRCRARDIVRQEVVTFGWVKGAGHL